MQAFRFRLERVLQWYLRLSRAEETRCAEFLRRILQTEAHLAQLKAERFAVERAVVHSSHIAAQDLAALERYRMRSALLESDFDAELRSRQHALEVQRKKTIALQRRVKLLEKLRDRRFEEHVSLADRELDSVMADAFNAKWVAEKDAAQ